jgi:hypothetical protein
LHEVDDEVLILIQDGERLVLLVIMVQYEHKVHEIDELDELDELLHEMLELEVDLPEIDEMVLL